MRLLSLVLVACAVVMSFPVSAATYTKEERTFVLNGRTAVLGDKLMDKIRARWVWPDEGTFLSLSTSINAADVRWALDFIAVVEMLNEEKCESLTFLESRPFVQEQDDRVRAYTGKIGLFDYAWSIDVCGKKKIYRVFNAEGEKDISVVPAAL